MPRPIHSREKTANLLGVKLADVDILYDNLDGIPCSPSTSTSSRSQTPPNPHTSLSNINGAHKTIRKRRRPVDILPSPSFEKSIEDAVTVGVLAYCEKRLFRMERGPSTKKPPRPSIRKKPSTTMRKRTDLGNDGEPNEKLHLPLRPSPLEKKSRKKKERSRVQINLTSKLKPPQLCDEALTPKMAEECQVDDVLDIPKRSSKSHHADHPDFMLHIPRKASQEPPQADKKRPRSSQSPIIAKSRDTSPPIPDTPREHILHFARGYSTALSKCDKKGDSEELLIRTSLATFNGCAQLISVSVAAYVRELSSIHLAHILKLKKEGNGSQKFEDALNHLVCELSDEDLHKSLSLNTNDSSKKQDGAVLPPFLQHTMDVVQLTFRVWQRMRWTEDALAIGFLEDWYSSNATVAVCRLAMAILALWESSNTGEKQSENQRYEIVEWCVRLLGAVLVFEMSPVSPIQDSKDIKVSSLLITCLGMEGALTLPQLMDSILRFIDSDGSNAGRECRQAGSDLCQAYMTGHHCHSGLHSLQKGIWESILSENKGYLEKLMRNPTFWPLTVNSAIQTAKTDRLSDVSAAIGFLVSLLSESFSSRSLLQNQTKYREALLRVLLKFLERMGRNALRYFVDLEKYRRLFPNVPSSLDLIQRLMSYAAVQRELISSQEAGQKDVYLDSIEKIIGSVSQLVSGHVDPSLLARYAQNGGYGKEIVEPLKELQGTKGITRMKPMSGSEEENAESKQDTAVARQRAVAFGSWLIGSLGKSMEDGSRDMSQMNGLHVLLSRVTSNRKVMLLWRQVYRIQLGVERFLPPALRDGLTPDEELLLGIHDRNYFSMVMHGIWLRVKNDAKERNIRAIPDNASKVSSPERERMQSEKKVTSKVSFPNIRLVAELRSAVCSGFGYRDLDQDLFMLKHLEKTFRDRGTETLARYDRNSEHATTSWIKLQKKNIYIDDAKDLLERADKTLGHPCSCLPGNPPEDGTGSQSRIACSNDLCENRSIKVECVPGECGGGSYCRNQRMQRLEYAKMKMVAMKDKGVGVLADEDIPAGSFIGEYQGEVISMELFEKRRREYDGEKHFYFMTLTNKLIIDASRKSQATRFVNHSCEPNAETQKWNAGGEPRVGIFASRCIAKGEEITFNYSARSSATDTAPCLCGAKTCRGVLTAAKDSGVDNDDIEPDVACLANRKGWGITTQDVLSGEAMNGAGAGKVPLKEMDSNHKKVDVEEKTRRGKKDLGYAEELKLRVQATSSWHYEECALDETAKDRLKKWELTLVATEKKHLSPLQALESVPAVSGVAVPRVRIPRRATINPAHQSILRKFVPGKDTSKTAPAQRSPPRRGPQKPVAAADVYYSVTGAKFHGFSGSRQSRTSQPQRDASDPSKRESGRVFGGSGIDSEVLQKSAPDPITHRKMPRKSFLPTASKNKKPRPAPKFASRPRTSKDGSDDSMDEFSIASDAEPVIDESPLTPSHLPDGSGACSDDEFVAAPPVGSEVQKKEESSAAFRASRPVLHGSPGARHSRVKELMHPAVQAPSRHPRAAYERGHYGMSENKEHIDYGPHAGEKYRDRGVNGCGRDILEGGQRQAPARPEDHYRRDEGDIPLREPASHHGYGGWHGGRDHRELPAVHKEGAHRDLQMHRDIEGGHASVGGRDVAGHREQRPVRSHRDVDYRTARDRREIMSHRGVPPQVSGSRDAGGFRGSGGYRDMSGYRDGRSRGIPGQWHGSYREPGGYREEPSKVEGRDQSLHPDRKLGPQGDIFGLRNGQARQDVGGDARFDSSYRLESSRGSFSRGPSGKQDIELPRHHAAGRGFDGVPMPVAERELASKPLASSQGRDFHEHSPGDGLEGRREDSAIRLKGHHEHAHVDASLDDSRRLAEAPGSHRATTGSQAAESTRPNTTGDIERNSNLVASPKLGDSVRHEKVSVPEEPVPVEHKKNSEVLQGLNARSTTEPSKGSTVGLLGDGIASFTKEKTKPCSPVARPSERAVSEPTSPEKRSGMRCPERSRLEGKICEAKTLVAEDKIAVEVGCKKRTSTDASQDGGEIEKQSLSKERENRRGETSPEHGGVDKDATRKKENPSPVDRLSKCKNHAMHERSWPKTEGASKRQSPSRGGSHHHTKNAEEQRVSADGSLKRRRGGESGHYDEVRKEGKPLGRERDVKRRKSWDGGHGQGTARKERNHTGDRDMKTHRVGNESYHEGGKRPGGRSPPRMKRSGSEGHGRAEGHGSRENVMSRIGARGRSEGGSADLRRLIGKNMGKSGGRGMGKRKHRS